MITIDFNCDMGESVEAIRDGSQDRLMEFISSANIACGGHAGDRSTMEATIMSAVARNVVVGAHPGYPDKEGFGRSRMNMTVTEISKSMFDQITRLYTVCKAAKAELAYVKPHGALYNEAALDVTLAEAIAIGVTKFSKNVAIVGLAGSKMLDVFRAHNLETVGEGFVDRTYDAHGFLTPRGTAGALITDPHLAARQALDIVQNQFVKATDGSLVTVQAGTICLHGDTPGSLSIAQAVSTELKSKNILIKNFKKNAS